MAASRLISEARETRLGGGVIRYRDEGDGPVLLFVHGVLANGTLWRDVVGRLSRRFRCIVPDLPLGGHSVPMESGADLTLPGVARMVADLMEMLDLRDVTLVGNDTGGAICQVVISEHPERVGRLVLTNCATPTRPSSRRSPVPSTTRRSYSERALWIFSRGRFGRVSRSGRSSRPLRSGQ